MTAIANAKGLARRRRSDPSHTNELALRWQDHGDLRARDELFEEFLPLARKLAGRYVNPNEPLEDLVQVAAMGLLGAVNRFDPRRGIRFPAFAVPTILGELKRHFRNTGWSAHVPRGAQEIALRVDRAAHEITARTGRSPRVEELAQYLELDVHDVMTGHDAGAAHYSVSFDAPVATREFDDPESLGENLGVDDDTYGLVELRLSLSDAIRRLPYTERQALSMRMVDDLRQSEIAERMGCSQMQVSRLLRRAVATLRELTDPELL